MAVNPTESYIERAARNPGIHLIIESGYCQSRGCFEFQYNYKTDFTDDAVAENLIKAFRTIREHKEFRARVSPTTQRHRGLVLISEAEEESFMKQIRESYPCAELQMGVFGIKHGNILYEKTVRFPNITIEHEPTLLEIITKCLPTGAEEEIRTKEQYCTIRGNLYRRT